MQSRRNCGIILGQPRAKCENYDGMEGCPYEKALVYRQSPCGKDKIPRPAVRCRGAVLPCRLSGTGLYHRGGRPGPRYHRTVGRTVRHGGLCRRRRHAERDALRAYAAGAAAPAGLSALRQHQRLCHEPASSHHAARCGRGGRHRHALPPGRGAAQRPLFRLCGLLWGLYPVLLLRHPGGQERPGPFCLHFGGVG